MAKAAKAAAVPVRSVDVAERRARMARRHHVHGGAPLAGVEQLARDLVGLHATDPATVYLSIRRRLPHLSVDDVSRALWTEGTVVKHLCMRRTLFVLPHDLVPAAQAAASDAVAKDARRSLVLHLGWAGVDSPERFLEEAIEATDAALRSAGAATTAELAELVPALKQEVDPAPGKAYGGMGRISNRVLTLLGAEGRAVRAQPRGGLTSSLVVWAPMEAFDRVSHDVGTATLVERWLHAFGPGTVDDLAWWLGGTKAATTKALAAVGAVPVDLGGAVGWLAPDDVDPVTDPGHWVALFPGLDPTPMGWKERDWYLGPHKAHVFDTNGNVGQTVVVDGRIVGAWAQAPDGAIHTRLVEDVTPSAVKAIAKEAKAVGEWLGDVRVAPRFPVPLQKQLTAELRG